MWAVVTSDDKLIDERDCLWPDLPAGVRIKKLLWRDGQGRVGGLEGFDSYGFQRTGFATPTSHTVTGVELIGVKGNDVTVVEISEHTGAKSQRRLKRPELTYNPGLLRDGIGG